MDYISFLINLIIAIVVSIITSYLSLRGFYKKEIWLRKEAKYSQIVDSLNKIQQYYSNIIDDLSGVSQVNESEEDELNKMEYKIAKRDLEILSSSPMFIIHKDISDILNELVLSSNTMTKEERMGDYFSYYDRLLYEVKQTKRKIAEIANKDLGIR